VNGLLHEVWKRRASLVVIWLLVMSFVAIRVFTMETLYASSALLRPLPLEQVQEMSDGGIGGTSVRSLLSRGSTRDDFAVAAFLRSRQLMDAVVSELDLKPELFPERWDVSEDEWIEARGGEPSDGAARRLLDRSFDATYDEFTGLLLLEVRWNDPERAREIADAFLDLADRLLRRAAVAEGERRIEELEREMETAAIGEVGVYLAEEMTRAVSTLTSIKARARYAFRVIDPPVVPDRRSWPPRLMLLLLSGLVTAAVEVGVVGGQVLRRGGASGNRDD
jgi:uncharacterized protein involved in exopolysaccharide biosynthesis